MRTSRVRASVAAGFLLLAGWAALTTRHAAGQAAVPLSRPGQEDVSFWVNHNGLIQYDVEGEVGFGDLARILLRRRSNAPLLTPLRDRFTFQVQDIAAVRTPDVFRAEIRAGKVEWTNVPDGPIAAAASRTVNLPLIVVNRDATPVRVEAAFVSEAMASRPAPIMAPPNAAAAIFLRAVHTAAGPVQGRIAVNGAETPVRFDIRALAPLRVRILDEEGAPAVARVYLTGSDGLGYAPRGSSARLSAIAAEPFFHADGAFELDMPAGETLIEATRGPEYELSTARVALQPGQPAEATLRLRRWTRMRDRGWWSADVHIHANYTATHHQVIEPRDVRLQVFGEDLNYANMMVANSGGAFIHDRQYFEGRPHRLSSGPYRIQWNEENRSGAYGHMCFLGLKELVEPFYNGFRDTPHWEDYPANYPLAQRVFDQGGAVSYAHPGMAPTFEAGSIKELPVDLALGHRTAMDVLSNSDEAATTEMWHRLLNCGFRVGISAGTDAFTNVADHYSAGGGRVYVRTGSAFDYAAWLRGFREGRSFASNGPVVRLAVNGREPGDEVALAGGATVAVEAEVETRVPLDTVEIVMNGRAVVTEAAAGRQRIAIRREIPMERSAWIAVRALGPRHRLVLNDTQAFAHTSPVYVTVAGKPVRVAADLAFYREWVEKLIARTESRGRFANETRKREVLDLFRKALEWYRAAEAAARS